MEKFKTNSFCMDGHSNTIKPFGKENSLTDVLTSSKYLFLTKVKRKVCFLVIDFTWKVFSQTGNIETYLLLKELEKESINNEQNQSDVNKNPLETKL